MPTKAITEDKDDVTVFMGMDVAGYVDKGELYIEIDRDVLDDGQIFTTNDTIWLHFFYDVAYTNIFGAAGPANGFQCDEWFYEEPDENGLYNVTRFSGMLNGYLDGYDLGLTNFDPWEGNTSQEVKISLEEGWHTFSVVAAECVSDNTHTSFEWKWVKDQVSFYVTDENITTPPAVEETSKKVVYESIMRNSENMTNGFEWSMWDVRPVAEPADVTQLDITTKKSVTKLTGYFNTTWQDLVLADYYGWDCGFNSSSTMGKGDVAWYNLAKANVSQALEGEIELNLGMNYVVFAVVGFHASDPGAWYGIPFPTVQFSSVIYAIDVIPGLGPSFGILISVSIFGLVAALGIKRFRK
ncbi:MAG: hypothetical protein ACTSQE_12060 [Candidatus Heimdallarchaeaceae archaeon]